MENLVMIKDGNAVVSSKKIADVFGKVHRNVTRAIEKLECSEEFRRANFEQSSYMTPQNKELPCFEMTRDGFAFLCMGFTGKEAGAWKEKYISAFNTMERSLLNVDFRMNQLTIESGKIKEAGSNWSKLGHEINSAKKVNKALSDELVKDVQISLGFEV